MISLFAINKLHNSSEQAGSLRIRYPLYDRKSDFDTRSLSLFINVSGSKEANLLDVFMIDDGAKDHKLEDKSSGLVTARFMESTSHCLF